LVIRLCGWWLRCLLYALDVSRRAVGVKKPAIRDFENGLFFAHNFSLR
jgi:hypothetical protein